MIVVAAVGFVLASDSEQGKTDARLSEAQRSASGLFREYQDRAEQAAREIARDPQLAEAIRDGRRDEIQRRFDELAAEQEVARGVMTLNSDGRYETGRGEALAPARTRADQRRGRRRGGAQPVGDRRPALRGADRAGHRHRRRDRRRRRAHRLDAPRPRRRAPARAGLGRGRRSRAAGHRLRRAELRRRARPGPAARRTRRGRPERLVARGDRDPRRRADRGLRVRDHRLALAAGPDRAAARGGGAMAGGDFAVEVPTEGNDEFAALGTEFNTMARELERRVEELQLERARLREAIRRVGQASAKGLDRDAVLEIVVQTAVDGVGAESGARRCAPGRGGASSRSPARATSSATATRSPPPRRRRWTPRRWWRPSWAGRSRSRTRSAPRTAAASSACSPSRARARGSPTPSGSCSPISPARPASRSRTSTCTRPSSARRSLTSSRACSTIGASRRSCSRRSSGPSASAATWA